MAKAKLGSTEMLERLIGFDTTSHLSNLELISFVQNYLEGYGISSELIYDETKKKANLYATIGPKGIPGVVLSGHTDVVPVEGQKWDSDPFAMIEKNNLLYGRGTSDMKGFIAVALAKLPEMLDAGLKAPFHFALSYDEEVGCIGARGIADHIAHQEITPRLCIVGEPTSMKPITGHKGVADYDCRIHGKECHSSLAPYGVNAVEYGAELIAHIKSVARRMQKEGPFNQEFDPPCTTVHVGTVKGGTALNIVPNLCEFELEIRSIPEQNPEEIVDEIRDYAWRHLEPLMKDIDPQTGITIQETVGVPGFNIANDHPAAVFVQSLSGANRAEKVSFGTEAGLFHAAGVPTVVCGPGNIEQAHRPNEFIALEQLEKCEHFLSRLISAFTKENPY
ncbi:MAG: acetylornithine deacetylase [Micavibrio sp.]|nr:MAG: acetylornithine deacetylase [Micavibrio sp.]